MRDGRKTTGGQRRTVVLMKNAPSIMSTWTDAQIEEAIKYSGLYLAALVEEKQRRDAKKLAVMLEGN